MSAPAVCVVPVTASRKLGDYHLLEFRAPEIAVSVSSGQFVNIAQGAPGHLLRRPFSVLGVRGDRVSVAFDVIGPGTAWLAGRRPGDALDCVGPLGRPFTHPSGQSSVLLVGGGYGAAPLFLLAGELRAQDHRVHLVLGAATARRLFDPDTAKALADELTIATDDGSAGLRGTAADAMTPGHDAVYACGPMGMLAAVSARAAEMGIRAEVAVEEFMACGIGVCWTCVIPVRANGSVAYLRSCTDGPVFEGGTVAWA